MSAIDLLARPKGSELYCEICKKPGIMKCSKCKVTHYCGNYHQELDAASLHPLICKDMAILRAKQPFHYEEDERQLVRKELQNLKIEIKNVAEETAKVFLLKEKAILAYPAATQAFHLARELYKDDSLDSVLNYALMAEVFLGLGVMSMAQDFMMQATWTVEKRKEVPALILIEILRIKGKVYMDRGLWVRANAEIADYVYCLAEVHDMSSPEVAVGLGYLGIAIKALGKDLKAAMKLFNKMAWTWLDLLLDSYIEKNLKTPTQKDMEDKKIRENERLLLEAQFVFRRIDRSIQDIDNKDLLHTFVFRLFSIQALLSIRENDNEKKQRSCKAALEVARKRRMDDAVKEEKRIHMVEILGDDYVSSWDKRNARGPTTSRQYLANLKVVK